MSGPTGRAATCEALPSWLVKWWVFLSASAAPLLLIGGWTVAAARQPAGFDPTVDTISALAGLGAADRWLMTLALLGVGIAHLTTAVGLCPAGLNGRVLLGLGGFATMLVAAFPLPVTGSSGAHTMAATVAFVALAAWPALASRRAVRGPVPWALRPRPSLVAAAVLLGLVGWFAIALGTGLSVGLAERVAAGAQALWPFVVAVSVALTGRTADASRRSGN